jgi:hypothetical protein
LIATGETMTWNTAKLRAKITDEMTPAPGVEAFAYSTDWWVSANGNARWGFFPPRPINATTWHDIWDGVVTNGHYGVVLYWS